MTFVHQLEYVINIKKKTDFITYFKRGAILFVAFSLFCSLIEHPRLLFGRKNTLLILHPAEILPPWKAKDVSSSSHWRFFWLRLSKTKWQDPWCLSLSPVNSSWRTRAGQGRSCLCFFTASSKSAVIACRDDFAHLNVHARLNTFMYLASVWQWWVYKR